MKRVKTAFRTVRGYIENYGL